MKKNLHININESQLIFNFLKFVQFGMPGVLIDVGAHVGSSLSPFAKSGWNVFALEPEESNCAELKSNFNRFSNVIIIKKAVSNYEGESDFYISDTHWGIHSLKPFDESHKIIKKVKVTTLTNAVIKKYGLINIDFLKIDTEGADFFAIQGLDLDVIKPKIIMCEFMDSRSKKAFGYEAKDIIMYLRKYGYHCYVSGWSKLKDYGIKGVDKQNTHFISMSKYSKKHLPYWGNLIFIKNNHLSWLLNIYIKIYEKFVISKQY